MQEKPIPEMIMAVDVAKIENWFSEIKPRRGDHEPGYKAIREASMNLALAILKHSPPCADQSHAIRLVREARLTACEAIRCSGA